MSHTPDSRDASLPFAIQKQIDAICDRFEAAWKAGNDPRLEEYLDELSGSARTGLLSGLLAVEIEYRRDAEGNRVPDDLILAAHPELSEEVTEALQKLNQPQTTESHVAAPSPDAAPSDDLPPDSIPGYTILKELNRGGQGVVYQAIQKSTHRKVALKVMLEGPFAGPDSRHRFEREVALVGSLRHPNIVPVFDSGVAQGRFFYAMEYVRGKSLKKYVQSEKLSLEQTLRLFKKVCDAVNCAHQRGVIHRDLKPTNILVDDTGEPHVLDFGLAKVGGAEVDGDSRSMLISVTGQVIGTLQYMCPEQAAGRPDQVDMRSDVYALGVILYELLTGTFPYDVKAQMADVLANILKAEPRRPSTIGRQINDEVETIILKTLSKEKERRYDTAGTLARDIDRYLTGEPIDAKRDSALYVLRKTLRRYKVHAGIAAGFVVLVTVAAIAMSIMYRQAYRLSEERNESLINATEASIEAEAARRVAADAERDARRLLYAADMNLAQQAWRENNVNLVQDLLSRHRPELGKKDPRGFEWYYLWRLGERNRTARTLGQSGRVRRISVSSEHNLLVVGNGNGVVSVWDLERLEEMRELQEQLPKLRQGATQGQRLTGWERLCVAFSNKGNLLAYPSQDRRQVVLRDVFNGEDELIGTRDAPIRAATFSPSDNFLALGNIEGRIEVWNLKDRKIRTTLDITMDRPDFAGPGIRWLAFDGDGGRLAVASAKSAVFVFDIATKEPTVLKSHMDSVWSVDFSPRDDGLLASSSADGTVVLWDLSNQEPIKIWKHADEVRAVAFAPDGAILAAGCRDNTTTLWSIESLTELERLKGHSHNVESLAFWASRDGLMLVTGSSDRTVKCWRIDKSTAPVLTVGESIRQVVLSPDGNTLAIRYKNSEQVSLFDLVSGRIVGREKTNRMTSSSLAISQKFLAVGRQGEIQLLPLHRTSAGTRILKSKRNTAITAMAFSSNEMLAAGDADGRIYIWRISDDEPRHEFQGHSDYVSSLQFSPIDNRLASGSYDGTVNVWRADKLVNAIAASSDDSVMCVAFSPDGRMLASGGYDEVAKIWDLSNHKPKTPHAEFAGHSDGIMSAMFTQKRLITASDDGTIRVWDLSTQQELLGLTGHEGAVESAVIASDGRMVVSGGRDGTVRLWRAASEEEVRTSGNSWKGD